MAHTKPLPFDRVRVFADVDAGLQRPERRCLLLLPRRIGDWRSREPARLKAVVMELPEPKPEFQPEPAAPPATRAPADDGPPAPGAQPAEPKAEAPRPVPPPASADPPAGPPEAQGAAGGAAAVPVAAIARAVEEATAMRSLAELLVDTCTGEDWSESGPWEFTLALHDYGLGNSSLSLRISGELLSLRFRCDGPAARGVLSRHKGGLQALLQEQLEPPLEVEIVIDDA